VRRIGRDSSRVGQLAKIAMAWSVGKKTSVAVGGEDGRRARRAQQCNIGAD
jgi:hypothetical protein